MRPPVDEGGRAGERAASAESSLTPHGALARMRFARIRNHTLSLKKDSASKALIILFGLTIVVAIGYSVSLASFRFAENFFFGPALNDKMVGLLFFALMILVSLSTILIAYTTLFIANETAFLFETPAPPRTVLFLKAFEAISFSAWASLFLCLPVLVAFGQLRDAPLSYYPQAAGILALFLLLAGLLGTTLSLVMAPVLRRLGVRELVVLALVVLLGLAWVFLRSFEFWNLDGENNLLVLDRFMTGLRAMQSPFAPSRWASGAVLAAAAGNHRAVAFESALLLANTLIFLPILAVYGVRRYGFEWTARRSEATGDQRRVARPRRDTRFFRDPVMALVAKDVLLFLRSPAQVSQSLLFILLMVMYSLSLMRVPDAVASGRLRLFIHYANIGAVSMILSSFTSRFLFPLVSLEGRSFWILGLAPIPRHMILRQKVLFGLCISLTLGLLTIVVSNVALKTPAAQFVPAVYTLVLASLCLTCLSAGLGAAYPSFDEDNPARIASGLGGTLNFFASAIVVAIIVTVEASPYILAGSEHIVPWMFWAAHATALAVTLVVCATVLGMGARALARSEF